MHPNGDGGNVTAARYLIEMTEEAAATTTTVERAVVRVAERSRPPSIDTVIGNALWTKCSRRLRGIKRDVNALLQCRLGHAKRRTASHLLPARSFARWIFFFFSLEPSICKSRNHGSQPRATVTSKKSSSEKRLRAQGDREPISIREREIKSEREIDR